MVFNIVRDKIKLAEMTQHLFEALKAEGLTPKGDVMLYQYHPMILPGFLRRNEIVVQV